MIRSTITKTLPLLTALLLASNTASALQVLDAVDGQVMLAKISAKEPTRIAISNGRIKKFVGNEGDLIIQKDSENGQIFVHPASLTGKPINLFVTDDKGATYTLLLQPVDIPAETVMLRNKQAQINILTEIERSGSYERVLKGMMLVMATDDLPPDMEVRDVKQGIALWREARFTELRTYKGRDLIGEKYLLTNVSAKPMVIAEQELYRKGVRAVSVEKTTLKPNESTNVFVVRERTDNE